MSSSSSTSTAHHVAIIVREPIPTGGGIIINILNGPRDHRVIQLDPEDDVRHIRITRQHRACVITDRNVVHEVARGVSCVKYHDTPQQRQAVLFTGDNMHLEVRTVENGHRRRVVRAVSYRDMTVAGVCAWLCAMLVLLPLGIVLGVPLFVVALVVFLALLPIAVIVYLVVACCCWCCK